MSRKLKFRAFDKKYNEGIPLTHASIRLDGKLDLPPHYEEKNVIIEQYTGLKDKNGKEIYEGDIVKNIEGVNETAVCVWDESNAEFDFRCEDGKYTRDNVKSWLEMYEVIGNIHENPELLKGGEMSIDETKINMI